MEIEETQTEKNNLNNIDEYFVASLNLLAAIGGDATVFLQAMYHWSQKHGKTIKGEPGIWLHNTIEEWHKQFFFWSKSKLKRVISSLEKSGYLLSKRPNAKWWNQTKWYSVNVALLSGTTPNVFVSTEQEHKQQPQAKEGSETVPSRMVRLWESYISCKTESLETPQMNLLEHFLHTHFRSDLIQWEKFLFYITHSKRLMGMSASNFKISLEWLLVEENLIAVKSGRYHSSTARQAYRGRKIKFNQQIKV